MRIIISGGSGAIGRALTESLATDGHDVIILSRSPERVKRLPKSARAELWDGQSANGWGHLVEGSQAIINLAGENLAEGRWTEERKRRIRQSRLKAGQAINEAIEAAQQKPAVVIQSSAVGYYGPHQDEMVTEDTPAGDDFLAQLCVDWEASTAPVEALGIRRPIIRSGVVLTEDSGALPRMALPFKMFVGGPLGSGRQWFPWLHMNDEIAAIRFLLDHEQATGPFNLTSPNPLTNAQFSKVLGRVLNRPAFWPIPAISLQLLFGELSSTLLEGQRVIPKRLQEMGFTFQYPQAEAALRDLL
jgi:uncharacterized protein (TIGR01777 family)